MGNLTDRSLRRWTPWALLWLTLLVRVAWLSVSPTDPLEPVDAQGYHRLALNLLAGRGFSLDWNPPFCPTAIRTPLYPLFLAESYRLLGTEPSHAVLFNLLLEVLAAAGVTRLGRAVGGRRVGMLAGLLYALNGTTQRFTGYLLTEPLLLPLLAAALWATVTWLRRPRPGSAALAGLFWGLAVLTKPNEQFLALGVAGLLAVAACKRSPAENQGRAMVRGLSSVVACGAALLLVLAPWGVRNRRILGRWQLSAAFEENTARVTAVTTLATAQGIAAEPWTETWEALYFELVQTAAQRYHWNSWSGRLEDWDTSLSCADREARHRQVAAVARDVVLTWPGAALKAHGAGVERSLLDPGHRFAYQVVTGRDWSATGVVDDIWRRMGESLAIGAVGDALHAFWLERVARIPPDAALIWWGLFAGRLAVWGAGLRGLWRLRFRPSTACVLAAVIVYHVVLPGPIAYDRFYAPAIPATVTLVALGTLKGQGQLRNQGAWSASATCNFTGGMRGDGRNHSS